MVIKSFTGKLQETDVWAMDKALRIKIVFQEYLENRLVLIWQTMNAKLLFSTLSKRETCFFILALKKK